MNLERPRQGARLNIKELLKCWRLLMRETLQNKTKEHN